jgi:hypothetical protein
VDLAKMLGQPHSANDIVWHRVTLAP